MDLAARGRHQGLTAESRHWPNRPPQPPTRFPNPQGELARQSTLSCPSERDRVDPRTSADLLRSAPAEADGRSTRENHRGLPPAPPTATRTSRNSRSKSRLDGPVAKRRTWRGRVRVGETTLTPAGDQNPSQRKEPELTQNLLVQVGTPSRRVATQADRAPRRCVASKLPG
jgi:hypothetical protein